MQNNEIKTPRRFYCSIFAIRRPTPHKEFAQMFRRLETRINRRTSLLIGLFPEFPFLRRVDDLYRHRHVPGLEVEEEEEAAHIRSKRRK